MFVVHFIPLLTSGRLCLPLLLFDARPPVVVQTLRPDELAAGFAFDVALLVGLVLGGGSPGHVDTDMLQRGINTTGEGSGWNDEEGADKACSG